MAIPSPLTLMGDLGAEHAIRIKVQVYTTAIRLSESFFHDETP